MPASWRKHPSRPAPLENDHEVQIIVQDAGTGHQHCFKGDLDSGEITACGMSSEQQTMQSLTTSEFPGVDTGTGRSPSSRLTALVMLMASRSVSGGSKLRLHN
jgi:hypothetical protein